MVKQQLKPIARFFNAGLSETSGTNKMLATSDFYWAGGETGAIGDWETC